MSTDLGDLAGLATALGLLDDDGDLVADWFTRPGDYLSSVLRVPHQREALVAFVDEMLGGDEAVTDAAGRQWLPLVDVENGAFSAYAVLQADSERVTVGAGVRVLVTSESGVRCAVEAVAPLFTQPLAGGDVIVVPGTESAFVDIALALDFPAGTASAGVALAGVSLDVGIPTWSGGEPAFGLVLRGLGLPGSAVAGDVEVRADRLDEVDDALVGLILGLVRAQAAGLPSNDPLRGLASLLGLNSDAVPDFPLDDVLSRGATALADWFGTVVADETVRADWLGGLAALVGGTVQGTGAAAQVAVTIDAATLRLKVAATPGAAGRPVITPTLTLDVAGAGGVTLALDVDPVSLDLGTGSAVAVPRLSLTARVAGSGGAQLLTPTGSGLGRVGLEELRAGFALDPSRRPMLVVEARVADVGATHFEVLDLTSPDALAAAAGQVITDAAGSLLDGLGAAGDAIAVVLGLPLPGGPALPLVDPARLLSDPLGAVAERWRTLLAGPAADARTVLESVRDLVADTAAQAVAVTGTGSRVDPWRVPVAAGVALVATHDGGVLAIGVSADVTAPDLAGSGIAAGLVVHAWLVELGLGAGGVPRYAAFLPEASGRLRFIAAGGGRLALGSPPTALSADELGVAASWRAATGVQVQPVANGARLDLGGAELGLPVPVVGTDGTLALDDESWAALEALVGAAAESLVTDGSGPAWVADAVRLLGWGPATSAGPGRGHVTSGPRLSLAGLVADPAAELEAYVRALLDVATDDGGVQAVLDVLSPILGPLTGRYGGGSGSDPWRLPLLGTALEATADAVPAIVAWLGPDGPQDAVSPQAAPVFGWQPGDPPLPTATLVTALAVQAVNDDVLADLLAGRGDLVAGLEELVVRWTGTDGLVALTETGLPAGVTGHRLSDADHSTPLAALDLTAVVSPVPATVVHIAVDATVLPEGLPADHAVDLTGSGLPPEAFTITLPADPSGAWAVRLGTRLACRGTGDPDGVRGQAGRLERVLRPLAATGPVLVVAHGGAGHPAVRAAATIAAEGIGGITDVVTVGTPWTTITADTLDRLPGADALRLLAALLPPGVSPDEDPDDDDLATARRVLGLWQALDTLGDPLAELRPPVDPTPVTGVAVHACVGSLGEASVRRAITAAAVTGLVERAWARADNPIGVPELTRTGIRWPILAPTARAGLTAALRLDLDLAGTADRASGDAGPAVVVRFALGGDGGWLLGGPDPGRSPGSDRPLGLRRLTARIDLPLGGGPATARVDLHDAFALGVRRPRWTVAGGPGAPADATPALPEVRALLGAVTARLTAAATADPILTGLLDALRALGLVGTDGGFDTVTLDRLLLDAAGVAATVRADAGRRAALAAALRAIAGDTRPAATAGDTVRWVRAAEPVLAEVTVDLGTGGVAAEVGGTGAIAWAVTGGLAVGTPSFGLRLGPDLPPAGAPGTAAGFALHLDLTGPSAALRVARPSGIEDVPLWPAPEPAAIGRALADTAPAALMRTLLDVLRDALADAAPAAGDALDTLLDLLGLLDGADRLRLPVGLVTDPAAWLRALPAAQGPAGLTASVPGLLDAVRSLLGVPGGTGRLEVTEGRLGHRGGRRRRPAARRAGGR